MTLFELVWKGDDRIEILDELLVFVTLALVVALAPVANQLFGDFTERAVLRPHFAGPDLRLHLEGPGVVPTVIRLVEHPRLDGLIALFRAFILFPN